jgi:hypothetical protein
MGEQAKVLVQRERSSSIFFCKAGLAFFFLTVSVALTPWNAPVLLGLKLNDLFFIASFLAALLFLHLNQKLIIGLLITVALILISIARNIGSLQVEETDRLIFLYKYGLIFLVPIVAWACINSLWKIRIIERVLFGAFLFLIFWVYLYNYQVQEGIIVGLSRVSYPGSENFLISDSHLYGNYLAVSLLFYFLYYRVQAQHKYILTLVIVALAIGAIFLCGSRNSIVAITVGFLFWIFVGFYNRGLFISQSYTISAFVVLLCFLVFYILFYDNVSDFNYALISRALNFSLANDLSALGRVKKFHIALDEWYSTSILFGAGLLGSSVLWYDGAFPVILVHAGLLGVAAFGLFSIQFFLRYGRFACDSRVRASLVFFLVYLVTNFITEFALVTRSILPIALYITLPLIRQSLSGR